MAAPGDNSIGVIFDLDGTLIDTLDDIADSINAVLDEVDIDAVPRARIRGLVGEGLASLLRRASGLSDDVRIADLVDRYRRIYSRRMLDRTRLYPGIDELLSALTSGGLPIAVLSNKPHEYTAPIAEALLGRWPLVDVRGAIEDVPRKPDPTAAIDIARRLERSPSNVVFVGDSSTDVHTGINAGMATVAVTWGYRDRDELIAARPTHLVDTPASLTDVLLTSAGR